MKNSISVLFENDDFIIVSKSAGILSIPDRYNPDKENLYHELEQKIGNVFIVHRLDKDTSGVICFAKNQKTHAILNAEFEHREVDKLYIAICQGHPPEESGIIDVPIAHSPHHSGQMIVHGKGKSAITKFRIKEIYRNYSVLELKPETGRTHQIRVHLAHIGCPIICDPFYGTNSSLSIADIKRNTKLSKNDEGFKPLIERTALHASELRFKLYNQSYIFNAELPKDMRAVVNQLGKWQRI